MTARGTERWRFRTESWVRSSPTVADGTVYVGSDDGHLYAVDARDGTERWRFETGEAVYSSPTVCGGTVYVGSEDGHLYAVDAADGAERWRFQTGDRVTSSPTVRGDTVYVGSQDDHLYAVDAAEGTERWRFQTGDRVTSSPTVRGDTVYVGSKDGYLYAVDARADPRADSVLGRLRSAIGPTTPSERWRFWTDYTVYASPTVCSGTVYVGTMGGSPSGENDHHLYTVDGESGRDRWRFQPGDGPTGDSMVSSPTVAAGTVYVGSHDHLYAVDAADGAERWRFETDAAVRSSPTAADGTVYVGSRDDHLYAVDAGTDADDTSEREGEVTSKGSRVLLATLGHHDRRVTGDPAGSSGGNRRSPG